MSVLTYTAYPCVVSDTMSRYAPMADAFARGEWLYAFHPRFGVLFQCLSGILCRLTGMAGDHACQVVSILFLSLSAVPLWLLARRLFGEKVAWWSLVALLVCDDFTRYAFDGLRDVGKCLAFSLLGYGAVAERPSSFAGGVFILVTLVSYGFAVASTFVFLWCLYMFVRRRYSSMTAPIFAWAGGTVAVTFMVHAYTGWWVPVPHFIKVLRAFV